jgi:hypothetical protein
VRVATIVDITAIKYQRNISEYINFKYFTTMGLLDLFKRKEQPEEDKLEAKDSLPEIRENDFIDNSEPEGQETSTYSIEFGSKLYIKYK